MKKCAFCGGEFEREDEYLKHPCAGFGSSTPTPPKARDGQFAILLRLFYTHNPFYLISACLILYGLNVVFGTSSESTSAWALLGVLAGYTCLMALAGLFIVRLGKVWEDARSILLIIVVLFLAVSLSFDEITISNQMSGIALLIMGLIIAFSLSEGLLRGLGIKLHALFRIPYYAVLSIFFVYPIFLSYLVHNTQRSTTLWGIFLFPVFSALVFLGLLPAIRRGSEYIRDNGTPWKWPWFPWLLFGVLALAVCVRAYSLSISFDAIRGMESVFGLYFLTPFILGVSVLILEMGIVSRKVGVRRMALVGPVIAMLLSFPGRHYSSTYDSFVRMLMDTIGSPVLLTTIASVLFYGYTWLRKIKLAEAGLVFSLLVFCVVGPRTINLSTLVSPQMMILIPIALVEGWIAIVKRSSYRAFFSFLCLVVGLSTGLSDTWFTSWHGALPIHLVYAAMLVVGAVFKDRFAKLLQDVGAYIIPGLCLVASAFHGSLASKLPEWGLVMYLMAVISLAFCYSHFVGNALYRRAGFWSIAISSFTVLRWSCHLVKGMSLSKGYGTLLWGGVAFALAFIISLKKGKILQKYTGGGS